MSKPTLPAVNGSSLLVNVNPTVRPTLIGAYDFDLLEQGVGKACIRRSANTLFWVGMNELKELAPDRLTRQAIAAAALDAISRLEDADTILLTSVIADSEDTRQVCARVVGRGVRLKKAKTAVSRPPVDMDADKTANGDEPVEGA